MLHLQNTFSIADLFNFFLLIATVVTVYLTYRQIKGNSKTQMASFSKDLYSVILADTNFKEAFYMIEYGRFHYDDHFHESSYEKSIDSMLYYCNFVCYLYDQKMLTKQEMAPFKYFLFKIYQDANIQKYTKFLQVHHLTLGMPIALPYQNYLNYCKRELQPPQRKTKGYNRHLTVDQAYVYYEEQKSKLDELLALAQQQFPQGKDDESSPSSQLRALDLLIGQFQLFLTEQQPPDSENILYKAISKSGVNDLSRAIIGLEALRARLLIGENKRLHKDVHSVPDKISIEHLIKLIN